MRTTNNSIRIRSGLRTLLVVSLGTVVMRLDGYISMSDLAAMDVPSSYKHV